MHVYILFGFNKEVFVIALSFTPIAKRKLLDKKLLDKCLGDDS